MPLPPWDALPYFQTPKETFFTPPAATWTQVAPADPNRVLLVFAAVGGSSVFFSTNPGIYPAGGGLVVNATWPNQVLSHEEWGPLVNAAWFAFTNSTLSVFEVALAKWPQRPAANGQVQQPWYKRLMGALR